MERLTLDLILRRSVLISLYCHFLLETDLNQFCKFCYFYFMVGAICYYWQEGFLELSTD